MVEGGREGGRCGGCAASHTHSSRPVKDLLILIKEEKKKGGVGKLT